MNNIKQENRNKILEALRSEQKGIMTQIKQSATKNNHSNILNRISGHEDKESVHSATEQNGEKEKSQGQDVQQKSKVDNQQDFRQLDQNDGQQANQELHGIHYQDAFSQDYVNQYEEMIKQEQKALKIQQQQQQWEQQEQNRDQEQINEDEWNQQQNGQQDYDGYGKQYQGQQHQNLYGQHHPEQMGYEYQMAQQDSSEQDGQQDYDIPFQSDEQQLNHNQQLVMGQHTFNKFHNSLLKNQMHLDPAEVHQDMAEQIEREDNDGEENENIHEHEPKFMNNQGKVHTQNNRHGQENNQRQIDHGNKNDGNNKSNNQMKLPNGGQEIMQDQHEHHHEEHLHDHNCNGSQVRRPAKKKAIDYKQKLKDLRHEQDIKQKQIIQERIQAYDAQKSEHKFHVNCKIQAEDPEEKEWRELQESHQPLSPQEQQAAWMRLTDDRREAYEQREQFKAQWEEFKISQNCYDTPKIDPKSQKIALQKRENILVEDRLNQEAMKIYNKKKQLLEQRNQEQMQECSFTPQILGESKNSKLSQSQSQQGPRLHERITELAKKKQELLFQLRVKEQTEGRVTFHPAINANSEKIASNNINVKDVAERLHLEHTEQLNRKKQLKAEIDEERDRQCRFQPQTNSMSTQILKSVPLYDGTADVVERQEMKSKELREKAKQTESKYQDKECSFYPQINLVSQVLMMDESTGRLMETQQQKVHRLSVAESESRQQRQVAREQQQLAMNSFTPSINEVSRILLADKPRRHIDDLAYNIAGKIHIEMMQEEQADEKMKECSFYPSILSETGKYQHVPAYYNQERCGKIVKMQTECSWQKQRQAKKQSIANELALCTFTPKINKMPKKSQSSASLQQYTLGNIKGLHGFLENKVNAKLQQQQLSQKQEKLFNLQNKYDANPDRPLTTIPKPFNLSQKNTGQMQVVKQC